MKEEENKITKNLFAAGDYLEAIKHTSEAFKRHGVQPTNLFVLPPDSKEEKQQDKIDWLMLTHMVEYDNHPVIRVIDLLICVFGHIIDFLAFIGNKFIERKIIKKYDKKRIR